MKLYDADTIVQAFEYFATSRALYHKLGEDFQLPSVSTLTRITSTVAKQGDSDFLKNVFKSLDEKQKLCVVLHDEVYIKKMMTYHGGTIYGKATNDPSALVDTMLGVMVNNLHGIPQFLDKMIPVTKLNADFLLQQIISCTQTVESAGGKVQAIICDGNRTNQAFFKKFKTQENKLWISEESMFL